MEIFTVRRGTGVGGQRFASASGKVSADQIWSGVYYMPWLRYYIVNTVDITGHPALLRKVLIPGKYFVLIRQKSLTIMTRHACSSSELFSKAWVWVPEPAKCFFIFFFSDLQGLDTGTVVKADSTSKCTGASVKKWIPLLEALGGVLMDESTSVVLRVVVRTRDVPRG